MNNGVSMAGGSEFKSMDRSVARRVRGLTRPAPGLGMEGECVGLVGEVEVRIDMADAGVEGKE